MRAQLIGMKHISGNKKSDGEAFAFDVACLTSAMSDRDKQRGAKGMDVHTPTVPERFADILNESNIGKEFEVEFYYSNNRENIAFVQLASK